MITRVLARWPVAGLVAGLLLPGGWPLAASQRTQERAADEERIVRTLSVSDGDVLELHNIGGDVTITGTSGNELHIEALKRGRRRRDARESLDATEVQIAQRATRVEVRTRTRRGRRSQASVDYTLRVPAGMVLDVHSVSGNLKVSDVNGRAALRAVSGDIVASGLKQLDAAETLSGHVRISSSTATDASVKTTSGDITLSDLTANSLKTNTVSGEVRLTNLAATWLEATSLSGDIEFSGTLSRTGRYKLGSHSGHVRFRPSDTAGFELTAGSFSGSVHSDLPIATRNISGGPGRRNLQGTVGDGGASVELTTFSGDITLLK